MRLNKTSSFILMHLLNGCTSALEVANAMSTIHLRSIQRSLTRLCDLNLIVRHGINNPRYTLNYKQILNLPINPSILEDINRPKTSFNFHLLNYLLHLDAKDVKNILPQYGLLKPKNSSITDKDMENLMIGFAWKSSELEGNTYSLLDTKLLLIDGIKAKNKTSFEIQMILNHQQVLQFIIDQPQLFNNNITLTTIEVVHQKLTYNLNIQAGIRNRVVQISASNYSPISVPIVLKERLEQILTIINKQTDIYLKVLLFFTLIPYLQAFEDGNKRLGRILASAVLMHSHGQVVNLNHVDAKELALAYLSFYEFNSLDRLSKIVQKGIEI